ncbi:rhamnulokinase [Clostridium saccharoperbutylacetonicum]|uniref:Rhamnulokinase n=1 Tax=Clostridium saccharoperbutylacetonicum N1-4(HMT) TaxID=931276 RepID=M1MMY2_9CLOT|nr:rhamnulokinase [Clostridium saccharoperbutylacetonicum]AGF57578.1 rhamnulokinase RhaB [Clostridium saccharoperbutylacetonicum N1-4(HMT)]NRT61654.1 rhamnulokinase [Clostridium saccharoperbutylacetonicum]NSB24977.1 rhamnulokinase [Clostridium saccharoperbutylacetonicum]NSB44348.1 rhamnulokinase [Clostridium saccharoperbutylacetonicum]
MEYYLAIDIGASSGRHILGSIENGKITLEEIYRFENGISKVGNEYCWNIEQLFKDIKNGIKKCKEIGKIPKSIGIDTWAVDFVLLDENDNMLGNAVAYRDDRTERMMEEVFKSIPKDMMYLYTGIQFQRFNTVYQLLSIKNNNPEILEKAKTFLMVPDYLNFLLTGKKANEYTNATSTQLVNSFERTWDEKILEDLGIKKDIFQEIKLPKTSLGNLRNELIEEFGFDMEVILPATHDTGSAFISSVCNDNDSIYLSSGTWSLIGVENRFPICVPQAMEYNFTNEGGIDYRYRFLKNIMGLWVIQEVRRNLDNKYSFAELVDLARENSKFASIVDVDDDRFLKPDNMIEEIKIHCKETNQEIPEEVGEIAMCVFNSLAHCYKRAVTNLEDIFEKEFKRINIFGGGCQNNLLNELVASVTGKEVLAGPVEATAIGNIVAQMISKNVFKDLSEARKAIKESFDIKVFN